MNACEEEILRLTGYKPRKKYKHYQEYLICLLREIHNLPYDKFTHLVSHQNYEWYKEASRFPSVLFRLSREAQARADLWVIAAVRSRAVSVPNQKIQKWSAAPLEAYLGKVCM